jgi:hypothetical protein
LSEVGPVAPAEAKDVKWESRISEARRRDGLEAQVMSRSSGWDRTSAE